MCACAPVYSSFSSSCFCKSKCSLSLNFASSAINCFGLKTPCLVRSRQTCFNQNKPGERSIVFFLCNSILDFQAMISMKAEFLESLFDYLLRLIFVFPLSLSLPLISHSLSACLSSLFSLSLSFSSSIVNCLLLSYSILTFLPLSLFHSPFSSLPFLLTLSLPS